MKKKRIKKVKGDEKEEKNEQTHAFLVRFRGFIVDDS